MMFHGRGYSARCFLEVAGGSMERSGRAKRSASGRSVNQQIDTAEFFDCCFRYFDGGFLLSDITVDENQIRRCFELLRRADRPRSSHQVVAVFDQCQRDSEADSTGSSGYNCDRLLSGVSCYFLSDCDVFRSEIGATAKTVSKTTGLVRTQLFG
jgi:hypothetical protein